LRYEEVLLQAEEKANASSGQEVLTGRTEQPVQEA
jgi:hypothetical protein